MSKQRHILVIRLSAMGDVAMTVPVLRALMDQYPDLKVTVLTKRSFLPIFQSIPSIGLVAADLNGSHKGILGLYSLSKELRKLKIDAVVDLHNVLRSNVLKLFLRGIPVIQIDKGRSEKKALTTGKLFQQLKTTHRRYADVFERLGYPISLEEPVFPKRASIDISKICANYRSDKPLIGIAPFAAHHAKMYPLELMNEVIADLSQSCNVVLFGGGQEEELELSRIDDLYTHVSSVAGKLIFKEELDLISNLDLMISMDSGNGHLAAIFGVKVLSIWGVTHPYAGFAPFNQPEANNLTADRQKFPLIPTSIYGNKYPEGYERAAGSIPVEAIIKKVNQLLG